MTNDETPDDHARTPRADPSSPFGRPSPPGGDSLAPMRAAFIDFYSDQCPRVVAFVMFARPTTVPGAEDAAQDAFLEAWRTMRRPGAWEKVRNPQTWIRTVALRCHDRPPGLQRRQPSTVPAGHGELAEFVADLSAQPDPADLVAETIDVLNGLRGLKDDQARVVMAFTIEGFPDSAIAEALGTDSQRVRNQRAKARKVLAQYLAHLRARKGGTAR